MKFKLFSSNALETESNTYYPIEVEVVNELTLKKSVCHDYTAIQFINNKRSKSGFIAANSIILDIDNTHSDEMSKWKTPKDISAAFPEVSFCIHYSRNNMKPKNGKTARPKFHVIFPVSTIANADEYSALAQAIQNQFPYFDSNALDAARFFFGTKEPMVEIHEGTRLITDLISIDKNKFVESRNNNSSLSSIIPEGTRNNTMFRFAISILTKLGVGDTAYSCFIKESEKCSPPLLPDELANIWKSASKIYTSSIACSQGYIPPEDYKSEPKYKPKDYSDIGQARLFFKIYGDRIRYSENEGYLFYNGQKWNLSEVAVQGTVHKLSGYQFDEAIKALMNAQARLSAANDNERDEAKYEYSKALDYFSHAKKYRSSASVAAVMKETRPMAAVSSDLFDNKPYLLNTPAGTYDLALGMSGLRPHSSNDYLTQVTAVSPSSEGEEIWNSMLKKAFCADADLIDYIQQIIGLAAIGEVKDECVIIAYGEGKNCKSSFWNSIRAVLGDYACTINSDLLFVSCRNAEVEKTVLKGKRLAIASEVSEESILSSKMLKNLTSTDIITAKELYSGPKSFKPTHNLILLCNHLPKVNERDPGTWRRIRIVPFNAVIHDSEEIKNYGEHLVKYAGGAILKWIIDGAKKVIESNYKITIPKACNEAVRVYRSNSDQITAFLLESCDYGEEYSCYASALYSSYKAFCDKYGDIPRSNVSFSNELLKDERIKRKHTNNGNIYWGIKIR